MTTEISNALQSDIKLIIADKINDYETDEEKHDYLNKVQDNSSNEFEKLVNTLINDYSWAYGNWEYNLDDMVYEVIEYAVDDFIADAKHITSKEE